MDDKQVGRVRTALRRVWGMADKYLWGTPAGKVLCGALLALALAPIAPAPMIAALAEPANQIMDALSEDPAP